MKKLAIAAFAATSVALVAIAAEPKAGGKKGGATPRTEPTPIGTLVLEENFSDYASITNGTVKVLGNSITPLTAASDLTVTMGESVDAKITAATNAANTDVTAALANKKDKQTAVTDPSASGTGLTFIATASQNENGDITVTKKTVQDGTTSQKGIVKLSSATNSTSETLAATPKAVNDVYNLAASKQDPATTLVGYGITDAKIENGTITLGTATITPLTAASDLTTSMGTSVDTKVTNATNALATAIGTGFKAKQEAVSDPTANGSGLTFIATASQNANGDMTVTKKTVQDGTTSQKGVVQLSDSTSSTSTTLAATANAVKTAKDAADAAAADAALKVPLDNVKVNGTALTSTTVVELGNAYIVYTTTGGKTSAALYAR